MLYRYIIRPESPLITPLMSDTFFGHFCWYLVYKNGDTALASFLSSFGQGRPAPVIFSSAFLSGSLPRPSLPALPRKTLERFVDGHFGERRQQRFEGFRTLKSWNKRRLVSLDQWERLKAGYSDLALYQSFLQSDPADPAETGCMEVSTSNRIDRITGTVPQEGGGGLFPREKYWYPPETTLDLYVKIGEEKMKPLVEAFLCDFLYDWGFGADKSVGMGALVIKPDETFDPGCFEVNEANAQMALSLTAFDGMAEYDAFYRLKTKFGKLGGNYAFSSPTGGDPRPYKKPILMYEPGAVFFTTDDLSAKPLLENVHSDPAIRHCGIPVTLPLNIREEPDA